MNVPELRREGVVGVDLDFIRHRATVIVRPSGASPHPDVLIPELESADADVLRVDVIDESGVPVLCHVYEDGQWVTGQLVARIPLGSRS
jgi:hypothetical protein